MRISSRRGVVVTAPLVASMALVLAACGGSGDGTIDVAQDPAGSAAETSSVSADTPEAPSGASTDESATKPAAQGTDSSAPSKVKAKSGPSIAAPAAAARASRAKTTADSAAVPAVKAAKGANTIKGNAGTVIRPMDNASQVVENQRIADAKNGVTDVGVTKDSIKTGAINMHGMALGTVLIAPIARGIVASYGAINDRGGVLGRRLTYIDCDDGPGEVSRAKSCIKKLAGQDKVFALVGGATWATASIHDDLKQYKLPYVGAWAYSQTEWQDPYMFPTHMSMIHEAMAGAQWVKNVVKPKTYGLICLTSPEMQLACGEVRKILDQSGAKMVKKADVSIGETSMSSHVLAMRAANPEHIVHYVINPATMAKWMVESAQQNYYPSKGVSGNHLAGEVVGSLIGKWPAGRYWTNTTYKLWGSEFMSVMMKYARANRGVNHHIVQAGYVGANVFALAAKAIGPNLTRERLMAQLSNGDVYAADASLDQRFSWAQSERHGNNWSGTNGQGREFIYKYESSNTMSNPDGSPSGFAPDPDQFVIYTNK